MRDIGDKIAARFFHALGFGEIVQHDDGAASGHGGGSDVENTARCNGIGARRRNHVAVRGFLHCRQEIGIAHAIDERRIQPRRAQQKAVHAAIRPLHTPVGSNGDHGVLHAVEERFEFILAGLQAVKTLFHAARRLVERGGYLAHFIFGSGRNSGRQIAGGDALGKAHDSFQPPSGVLRGRRRDKNGDPKSRERAPEQRSRQRPIGDFDFGQRIGEAHGSPRNRRGHIQERHGQCVALAFVEPDVSGQGGGKLLAVCVVFHRARIGLGIGQHFAGGIDDRSSGPGCLALLRSDVGQGVLPVVLHAVSEHLDLLRQVAFDLLPQGALPYFLDSPIQSHRGDGDHHQKHEHQLEEDATSQRGTSKRYPAPRTVFR